MSKERCESWIKVLQECADLVAPLDTNLRGQIQNILYHLQKDKITLAFGGHFKSGKSTVLNAMLSQGLLPTDDYPETGAICSLFSGDKDSITVYQGNSRRNIDFSTEAIRQEISLISQTGERRLEVSEITQVDITLRNSIIPSGVIWMDSPGINDTPEMNDCALRAARQADILLWVLSSRQCLSEPEIAFLSSYIQERGPASVVFVINIFLEQDTQQSWQRFLVKQLPVLQNKVQFFAPELGFTDTWQPLIIPISGRAVGKFNNKDFGGGDLHSFLLNFDSIKYPRVHCVCWFNAARNLQEVIQKTQLILEQEKTRFAEEKYKVEQKRQKAEQRKQQFVRELESAIDTCLIDWLQRAYNCGVSIANLIDSESLQRDDTYSRKLTNSLKESADVVANTLLAKISKLQQQYQQSPLSRQDESMIRQKLTSPETNVEVASILSKGKMAGSAATGALIGSAIFPGLGTFLGAAVGSIISVSSDYNKDVEQTKLNIKEAAERSAKTIQGRRQYLINFIVKQCTTNTDLSNLSDPNNTSIVFWESIYTKLGCLAQEAKDIVEVIRLS
jgi:Dynamin family